MNFATIQAIAELFENNRTRRSKLHRGSNHQHRNGNHRQHTQRKHNIEHALQHIVETKDRGFINTDGLHVAHFTQASMDQVIGEEVRNQMHRRSGITTLLQNFVDALLSLQRQRNKNGFDLATASFINQVGNGAFQACAGKLLLHTRQAAIVVVAHKLVTHFRVICQLLAHGNGHFVHTNNRHFTRVVTFLAEVLQ